MAPLVLVTGGCRSGKSAYARRRGEALEPRRAFVATSPAVDAEMRERIDRHRAERGDRWETIEEPVDLGRALRRTARHNVVLVDCLTLWISNMLEASDRQHGRWMDEQDVQRECAATLAAARECSGTVIMVTNEVGWGIVPENALARRYRDLIGRCNQIVAAGADEVVMIAAGIPLVLKGSKHGTA